ncbi:MAG: ComEC/Rec2 family competence protein, partial [Thermodesulfovibrionia bacterium]
MLNIQKIIKKHVLLLTVSILFLSLTPNAAFSDLTDLKTNSELAVHFIDVGEGDCIFIALPSGKNMLIDTGSPSGGPKAVQYLKSMGIKKIDYLILTHPHDDHIGGIFSIMSEFEVINFYDNGFGNFKSDIYRDYIKLVRKDLSKYNILQAGESFLFSNIRIEVLNPLLPPTGNLNNDSIVLRLIYGDIKILFSGDLGQLGEHRLLNLGTELTGQILKAGHHGENNTSSDDFLKSVKPETAIISVSRINKYARPHREILSRLGQIGAKIYRTDLSGNIILKTDGKTYTIKTE